MSNMHVFQQPSLLKHPTAC